MTSTHPSPTAERIQYVEQNLSPAFTFRNLTRKRVTLAERMERLNVPGVSIAVINNHQIEWAKGYGVLEAGRPEAVNPATLFQCASISKPVAAVTALRLVAEGKLDLDEDINTRLTSWKVPATTFQTTSGTDEWQPRITIRQLLSHTAGLTVHGFYGYPSDQQVPTLLQVLDGLPPANSEPIRVDTLPGLQYRYSGGGYCVLQQLLIDVTGKRYPDLVREQVLAPLGMSSSTSEQPIPADRLPNATAGHRESGRPITGKRNTYPEIAAAGLWSTPTDLARFALALQAAKAGVPGAILPPQLVRQMLTHQSAEQKGERFGLGVALQGEGENARFSHTGGNEGYRCILLAYQDKGIGAAVMTNGDAGWSIMQEVINAIAEAYAWPDYLPAEPAAIVVQPEVLNRYVGHYSVKDNFHFTITRQENQLFLQSPSQNRLELFAKSETSYFISAVDAEITFVQGPDDEVTDLRFKQNGRSILAKKGEKTPFTGACS